ncbi:hypothetical protein EDEG_00880 [Edhazardia aedis USNM 41457]|uniref:Uncharacterized protein n=1 Tax=Edhazardia aedis (strain USNM 41457) TaxID=1003232 RepID=J9DUQ7_EDHAE|nr:hypothetical protein EDEG_00880 [Edhazardia aedis USNM 41457]|eukprot:EJW05027.1 hypothetical protein EDEG_00880 [Edhazardia aedis USNM 41457]
MILIFPLIHIKKIEFESWRIFDQKVIGISNQEKFKKLLKYCLKVKIYVLNNHFNINFSGQSVVSQTSPFNLHYFLFDYLSKRSIDPKIFTSLKKYFEKVQKIFSLIS